MIIQLASDLHLEFPDNKKFIRENPLQAKGEILLLSGDIVPFYMLEEHRDFFLFCSDNFKKTYWIAGNHEYYNGNLKNRTGQFMEEIEANVHLVNNHCVQHGNTQIILSSLWTPISNEKAPHIQNGLNDYQVIKDGELRFTPARSTQLFEENLSFIKAAVASKEQDKCVVVTHHVPTFDNYPPEYIGSIINEAFAVDLNSFIESSNIDYWMYGHHHRNSSEFSIGSTKLITNQLGYVKYGEHRGFKTDCVINTQTQQ